MKDDDWQLEMLCNVAAAELLMPIGSFPDLKDKALSVDALMALQRQYDVSTEALLLRVVRVTEGACTVFCCSRLEEGEGKDRYRIDYAVGSRSWPFRLRSGTLLAESTVVRECTAIGYTAKGDEQWPGVAEAVHVEAVGIPPYPKRRYPRVVGIVHVPNGQATTRPPITYLRGDATHPRGTGLRIIGHVVNDRASRWGGGFALVVRRRFPDVQEDFISWSQAHLHQFTLGSSRLCPIDESLAVFSMICQHGYGPSRRPRIRYAALRECLDQLAAIAAEQRASIHMPRIGCGQAGGSWTIVSELIDDSLCGRGVPVTIYDLPTAGTNSAHALRELFEA
jgi:O-acetyl-ADP-ribose deacetylase (regulator of RNase III)